MKRVVLILITLSAWVLTASAASSQDQKSVQVTGIEIAHANGVVKFSFTLHAGSKVTSNSRSLVITPILQNGKNQTDLAPIVVRGARAKLADVRQAIGQSNTMQPFYTANGKSIEYSTVVPFENWMIGSELVLNGISAGSGSGSIVNIGLVADNLLAGARPVENITQVRQEPLPYRPTTTTNPSATPSQTTLPAGQKLSAGDELAARFSFVEPLSEYQKANQAATQQLFDYNMPLTLGTGTAQKENEVERFINMTREGALSIQFQPGSKVIAREFGDNNRALVDLISSIRALEASSDTKISHVIIVGFSSPEGTTDENEKLSLERATVAKDFLTANSEIKPETISIYNGSVDWVSLRKLVAGSDMADKYRILEILDNTPVWDLSRKRGRLGELMEVKGGEPYRYMLENFFPQLRQTGAYIKVYYENNR